MQKDYILCCEGKMGRVLIFLMEKISVWYVVIYKLQHPICLKSQYDLAKQLLSLLEIYNRNELKTVEQTLFLKTICSQIRTTITPITKPLVNMGRTIKGIKDVIDEGRKDIITASIIGKLITVAVSKSITAFCFSISWKPDASCETIK